MLFDDISRRDKRPRGHSEPLYDYLNRSARKSSEQVRNLLESWFSNYPDKFKKEFKRRFCSSGDLSHQSAFFELYMHELLLKLNFKVEIHPKIEEEPTHPEFLVFLKSSPIFYLECSQVKGSREDVAAEKRKNIVYDTLDKMDSPNFFLEVKVNTHSKTAPSGSKWRRILEKRLSELDPDELSDKVNKNSLESLPSWELEDRGWKVTFRPIPKSPEARGKGGVRPIGITWIGPVWCQDHVYICNAIKGKATKYGRLNLPYIIAINVISEFCDNITISNALFGEENITITRMPNGTIRQRQGRNPNGAWWGPKGPQNTRVSGVLIFPYLLWGNIAKLTPVLWHNPWATKPFDPNILPLPQLVPDNQNKRLELRKGRSVNKIFNLPENWPFLEEDDDC